MTSPSTPFILLIMAILIYLYLKGHLGNHSPQIRTKEQNRFERNKAIGEKFEVQVAELLNYSDFHILENYKDGRPDFKVAGPSFSDSFWVECKWRSHLYYKNKIKGLQWAEKEDIERYKGVRLASDEKVFIVIGLGGTPGKPDRMFILDLDERPYPFIFDYKLKEYERKPWASFNYHHNKLT